MRIIENNRGLILKDNPNPIRFLGFFFLLISSASVYGSLGGFSNYTEAKNYELILAFIFGIIGASVGSWLILTKNSQVNISAINQTANLIKSNLLGKKETSIPFYKLKQFIVSEKEDQDGDPIWKVDLEMESAEIIELSSVWLHDKPQSEKAANTANKVLKNNYL